MPTEENKAVMRRFCEEVFNQGKDPAPFHGPGYTIHRTLQASDGPAYTDFHAEILDQVAEGDKVVSRWLGRFTITSDYTTPWGAVIPSKGKQTTWRWISIDRIVDGKVVEAWAEVDLLDWWRQLGAI